VSWMIALPPEVLHHRRVGGVGQAPSAASAVSACGASIAASEPRSIALPRGIVPLGPLAAAVAFHFRADLVQRPRAQSGDFLPDHLERHPDRPLAALASDSRIPLGLKLRDGAGVCHA
jgi:hypothetical protein